MKTILLLLSTVAALAHADMPDLTGNYTGCSLSTSLGSQQLVIVLVKMPTGFGDADFHYTGGIYWKNQATSVIFFNDVRIDQQTSRLLMTVDIKPLHDLGVIAASVLGQVGADGSIRGEYRTNSTSGSGRLQTASFTVSKTQEGEIPSLQCNP